MSRGRRRGTLTNSFIELSPWKIATSVRSWSTDANNTLMMIDTSDKLIAFGGSLSGIIASVLYAFYRSRHETASVIKVQCCTLRKLPESIRVLQSIRSDLI